MMELRGISRRGQIVRMDDQDRVSQASSVATISYFPTMQETDGKVQTFGKRCHAAKRDPNCPVIIRGWLNKKDSSGLKLWKRRWFVLSDYCLFYYKDSREESVLGSIPLPSYKILFCTPRECKNRKFTFKVVHQGMRSYFFSADTQEDMLGWVRALSQSATMEPDNIMNRRCSSYQDFTHLGGSRESVDFLKPPSEEESPTRKHRHVSRTLSEPNHLGSARTGRSLSEPRDRRNARHRNRSPSNRTPSPPETSRRRSACRNKEDNSLHVPLQAEIAGTGSLNSRGQLGSRPHTPVGRVDIRPLDDPVMLPQTLFYTPASPKLEFKSAPTTPSTERWQSLSKPAAIYGSVHHSPGSRKPLGKSHSTGADLLPPLPPSTRAPNHHHQHRGHLSACELTLPMTSKLDPRELPPIRPLESDADVVLTRLCGCDKLLQSLSVELAQLQMDKDSVQCALEVSRLQVEEWRSQGPRAHEEALTQKALLQEELVTIRARMCDVSLEMERVWSQYERMESELSVIRSHLQHICNFGIPQEQSQAQRELWMMEDILDGLKINRDHFCFLLGLQRHHLFHSPAPHPGSPTERLQMHADQEPPARPPLPLEIQENHQRWNQDQVWTESPYEGIYGHTAESVHRKRNSQPDLLNVKSQKETSGSQSDSRWIPADTTNQPTKRMKVKMSEEEQMERIKRNQERMTNKKKLLTSSQSAQSQSSDTKEEAPFPLRVTRVVTAVLPSSLVARRVSVEDPPSELDTLLPEQLKLAEESRKQPIPPMKRSLFETLDSNQSLAEMRQEEPVIRTSRQQHQGGSRTLKKETEGGRAEATETSCNQNLTSTGNGRQADEQPGSSGLDSDSNLSPEQRDAKLRRVERIRERVMRSTVREKATAANQQSVRKHKKEVQQKTPETARKPQMKAGLDGFESCGDDVKNSAGLSLLSPIFQDDEEKRRQNKRSKKQAKSENRTQCSGTAGITKTKVKLPATPSRISSVTDGAEGFFGCENENTKKFERADDDESYLKSDVRAKWFLSTNQWQGFIPLQIPPFEMLSNEDRADVDNRTPTTEDVSESNGMSTTMSESLEKMKENHSLFYKLACDISISDSDITKSDAPTSSKPEEEEEGLVITEEMRSSPNAEQHNVTGQNSQSEENDRPADERSPSETTLQKSEDNSRPEDQLVISEPVPGNGDQDDELDQHLNGCVKPNKKSGVKESKSKKEDQERSGDLKKPTCLVSENNEKPEKDLRNSISGGVTRSASFGKPRVTVIKTSL